jgi:hypothetical protein
MSSNRLHYFRKSWPICRSLWLALALLGMFLPLTGWQASIQLQHLCAAGNSSDERGSEFPGEEEGDPADGDLETLLFRRSPRESLPGGVLGQTWLLLPVDGQEACSGRAVGRERDATLCSAALIPLRC